MEKPFHLRLKEARRNRGLTQQQLARAARVTRSQISHYECGRRAPTAAEVARLEHVLGVKLGFSPPRPRGGWQSWRRSRLWERFRPDPGRYVIERDRDNWVRLRAARSLDNQLYEDCLGRVIANHGRRGFKEFLTYAAGDSGYDMLSCLRLLAGESILSYVPIPRLGWSKLPIVQESTGAVIGHRPWPVIVFQKPMLCALFPQVSVQAGRIYRMDFLACVRLARGVVFANVEVDALGHDSRFDRERTRAIGLPRVKLSAEDVLAPDFIERLFARLAEALRPWAS